MIKKKSTHSISYRIIRYLREWHRKLGIFSALFIIFLSISGIALNHTTLFSLSEHSITSSLLLNHYGIKPPSDIRFYQQKQWLVTEQFVWLDDKLVYESDDAVVSMSKFQAYRLLATTKQLVIFTNKGELVDKLDSSSDLPVPIQAMSVSQSHILLKTPHGYYQGDSDFFNWRKINTLVEPKWITSEAGTPSELTAASIKYQSQFLNWERVILDAHSGRILGGFGVILMDLVAFMLILLSISGMYMWVKYSKKKR
ncbi:MAG: PepSY domain-containing protein [Colwellia sp.]|nr:PepSY domain-containing protein [Colwellia sp.]